jgi:hypothetical protein
VLPIVALAARLAVDVGEPVPLQELAGLRVTAAELPPLAAPLLVPLPVAERSAAVDVAVALPLAAPLVVAGAVAVSDGLPVCEGEGVALLVVEQLAATVAVPLTGRASLLLLLLLPLLPVTLGEPVMLGLEVRVTDGAAVALPVLVDDPVADPVRLPLGVSELDADEEDVPVEVRVLAPLSKPDGVAADDAVELTVTVPDAVEAADGVVVLLTVTAPPVDVLVPEEVAVSEPDGVAERDVVTDGVEEADGEIAAAGVEESNGVDEADAVEETADAADWVGLAVLEAAEVPD